MFEGQALALTFDGWTSTANRAYYGYYVSWINESFKKCSLASGIFPFPGEHSSERIEDHLLDVLAKRGIEKQRAPFVKNALHAARKAVGRYTQSAKNAELLSK
jgi:hypothetical protein